MKRGGAQNTWNGPTGALPWNHAWCVRHSDPVGRGRESSRSTSAHTRNRQAAWTRRGTGPTSRNAQTTWNGVPAGEEKEHPGRTTRHTHREERRGRVGGAKERRGIRHRPQPPGPAAHPQPGHRTRQGSSGTQCYASALRLGSLRASPWGSHWPQASSTGPAAPAPGRPSITGAAWWVSACNHGC